MTVVNSERTSVVDSTPVLVKALVQEGILLGRSVAHQTVFQDKQAEDIVTPLKKTDSTVTEKLELIKSSQLEMGTTISLSNLAIDKIVSEIKPLELLASSNATSVDETASKNTALHKHVEYFVDADGKITQSSIYEGFRRLGFSYFEAFTRSVTIAGVTGGIISGCPFARVSADKIHQMVHPCHSGVFKEDGTIDEQAFEDLKMYAQTGKEFLSQHDIQKMREDAIKKDKDKDPLGIWQVASAGEWADLLRIACDHWELIDGQYIPALTFSTLRMLFTDGSAIFKKVEKGELPIKKPEM